ncbi:glycosyltransferase [Flavobacterium caeni]|uniref:Glycosyltransferase, catalytic subunit of cellulose synthase and poly-beta-1,6-N-acetylglucosamine synthase n=1 Tax=Flavobacterium caeni TaxID=490189 RepID=A0A1G5GDD5_9FLAO|nr:glycosyltransferase [Flavobacterium caeni]SCY49562.1 Glycosyltransferase, catalytic subunit of cellulose synthase and poly-beta-1,6-N-acetylglucosamine synthase [Flavobacterium caeni]
MIVFLLAVVLVYAVTIAQLIYGFGKIKTFTPTHQQPQTYFSIVVPFRNEAKNLPDLLASIKQLDYPIELIELILVDDFSEDQSQRVVYDWRMNNGQYEFTLLENINMTGSPKKDAIARAIHIVKGQWVVTTDADCTFPKGWLRTLDNFIQQSQAEMLIGSVSYAPSKSFIRQFQQLDLASLQGATIGSFGLGLGFMCNGANFAYTKKLFHELGGFAGNQNKATGDDVFLVQKAVANCPEKVHYLKAEGNIVSTKPLTSWGALFQQHARWASKAGDYQSVFGKDLAVIVFLGNLAILMALALTLFGKLAGCELVALFAIKFLVDTILLYKTNQFLTGKWMWGLVPSAVIYPFFSVAVAVYVLVFGYSWKGRRFKV